MGMIVMLTADHVLVNRSGGSFDNAINFTNDSSCNWHKLLWNGGHTDRMVDILVWNEDDVI